MVRTRTPLVVSSTLLLSLTVCLCGSRLAEAQSTERERFVASTQMAMQLAQQARWAEASPYLEEALGIGTLRLAPDSLDLANLMRLAGDVYAGAGDSERAIQAYDRAIEIFSAKGPDYAVYTASARAVLGMTLFSAGQPAAAQRSLETALPVVDEALGIQSVESSQIRASLGMIHASRGEFERADRLLTRGLEGLRQTPSVDPAELQALLSTLADVLSERAYLRTEAGDPEGAAQLFGRALAVAKEAGAPPVDVAQWSFELAELEQQRAEFDRADALYQQALTLYRRERGEQSPEALETMNGLAGLLVERGSLDQAKLQLERALQIQEGLPNAGDGVLLAKLLTNLGVVHRQQADLAAARSAYERALALIEDSTERALLATLYANLAVVVDLQGDPWKGMELSGRALEIRQQLFGPKDPRVATVLHNLAWEAQQTGELDAARESNQRALTIRQGAFGERHPAVAESLNALGSVAHSQGEDDRAASYFRRAVAIREGIFGSDSPESGESWLGLSSARLAAAPEEARQFARRSLAIFDARFGTDHPDVGAAAHQLALAEARLGEVDASIIHFQTAIRSIENSFGPDHPWIANSLRGLADVYELSDRPLLAIPLRERGLRIRTHDLRRRSAHASPQERDEIFEDFRGLVDRIVTLHARVPGDPAARRLALEAILEAKGRSAETAAQQQRLFQRVADPGLLNYRRQLSRRYSTLTTQGSGTLGPLSYVAELRELETEIDRIEAESARTLSERSGDEPTADRIRAQTVADRIEQGQALLEIYYYYPHRPAGSGESAWEKPRYAAYLLRSDGTIGYADLGDAERIYHAVMSFRKALQDYGDATAAQEQGRLLFGAILEPLWPTMRSVRQLYVAPDAALNLVPFGAFVIDEDGRYLAEDLELSYLGSGRELLESDRAGRRATQPVIVGSPSYGPLRGSGPGVPSLLPGYFTPLPGTATEAETIAGLLKGSRLLLGPEASESALKQLSSPELLHIATHGFFFPKQRRAPTSGATDLRGVNVVAAQRPVPSADDQEPVSLSQNESLGQALDDLPDSPMLRAGIALAGANQRWKGRYYWQGNLAIATVPIEQLKRLQTSQLKAEEDGILSALELAGLDLAGTRLVVLSACETGLGEVRSGEGVYGLRRALSLAGAHSQIVSLWNVADAATRDLMIDLYKRMLSGDNPIKALVEAQRAMLRSEDYSHPYYWSAFIASGLASASDGSLADAKR